MTYSLNNIEEGDYVTTIYNGRASSIKKVIRITKTQIITRASHENPVEVKWNKRTGNEVGVKSNPRSHRHICMTTEEHRDEIRKSNVIYQITTLCTRQKLEEMDLGVLEDLYHAITGGS